MHQRGSAHVLMCQEVILSLSAGDGVGEGFLRCPFGQSEGTAWDWGRGKGSGPGQPRLSRRGF